MNNFRQQLARLFIGRTGPDAISRTCSWLALIFIVITMLTKSSITYFVSIAFLCYGLWRIFSKNYQRRYFENQKFLSITAPIRNIFSSVSFKVKRLISKIKYDKEQRKHYTIFHCPSCRQKLRAPKGRGKIQVTCNNCHTQFIKKV